MLLFPVITEKDAPHYLHRSSFLSKTVCRTLIQKTNQNDFISINLVLRSKVITFIYS